MKRIILSIALHLVVLASLALGTDSILPASSKCECDQIWLVSARDVVCGSNVDCLSIQKFDCGQWQDSSLAELNESQVGSEAETLVYIHGYQTDLCNAKERGVEVYENLFQRCREVGPIRFVIWAWKSEKEICRPVQDFQIKSSRAVLLGDVFAESLNYMGPKPPVVLGYSLGVQVMVSGLVRSSRYQGAPVSLATIAAATDCCFASKALDLCNSGRVKRSVIFLNDKDRAIRVSEAICRRRNRRSFRSIDQLVIMRPYAFGEVQVVDISNLASKKHSVVRYTAISAVVAEMQQLILQHSDSTDPLTAPAADSGPASE